MVKLLETEPGEVRLISDCPDESQQDSITMYIC